jgi:transcriptional regulator with XRE-family HTH domain
MDMAEDDASELALYRAIARRVRLARIKEGLTPAELAERVGVKTSYMITLERGFANPTAKTLHRVATALGIEPAELLPGPAHPEIQSADLERISRLCENIVSLILERQKQLEENIKKDVDAALMLREVLAVLKPLEQPSERVSTPEASDPESAEGCGPANEAGRK